MQREIERKIEVFEIDVKRRSFRNSRINMESESVYPERDWEEFYFKSVFLTKWLNENAQLLNSEDKDVSELTDEYFKRENNFEQRLGEILSNKIKFSEPSELRAVNGFINAVALSIAYKKLEKKALVNIIASSVNL